MQIDCEKRLALLRTFRIRELRRKGRKCDKGCELFES
jgi:hypothetical protein